MKIGTYYLNFRIKDISISKNMGYINTARRTLNGYLLRTFAPEGFRSGKGFCQGELLARGGELRGPSLAEL